MEGICPEEAFLVGLLHEAASLPTLLGWPCADGFAAELATHWCLPGYLRAVVDGSPVPPRWREVLDLAYAWSRGEQCLLTHSA